MEWVRVTDVRAWLSQKGTRRVREHSFTKRVRHWPYCSQCGLVLLRNPQTAAAARAKCVTYED